MNRPAWLRWPNLAAWHGVLVFLAMTLVIGGLVRFAFGAVAGAVTLLVIGALVWGASYQVYRRMADGVWPWAGILARLRAEWIARTDQAPRYWVGPARDADHAAYRAEYQALVEKPSRSRGDLLLLVEVLDGLKRYHDDPLVKPPVFGQRFLGAAVAGGVSLKLVAALGALAVLGLTGLWVRGEMLVAARDRACSRAELIGRTTRQPCRDLGQAVGVIDALNQRVASAERARATQVASAVEQALETAKLNQRRRAREAARVAARQRAQDDSAQAARDARAPDWDSRLRDLADPGAVPVPPAEPGAGGGAAR